MLKPGVVVEGHIRGFLSLPDLRLFQSWDLWHSLTSCPCLHLRLCVREVLVGEVEPVLVVDFVMVVDTEFVGLRYLLMAFACLLN